MKTFRHSGTLGDLIYSLHLVKKLGGGEYQIALENLEACVTKYGYQAEHVDPQHRGRFTAQDIAWLEPLLNRQPYVIKTSTWRPGDVEPDVDLDAYRAVLYRTFEGNILEAYHRTFNVPFTAEDLTTPWLSADTIKTKPIVVSRSFRYRPPNGDAVWQDFAKTIDFAESAIFVGTVKEHEAFVQHTGADIEYRPVSDFLELASIINGADLFMGNQGFAYSLAIGLGRPTVLEINKLVPMHMNECYFPRENCQYI
jgi:hypothetical protein